MVKIDSRWQDRINFLLDQAAPILSGLKEVLGQFDEPEVGCLGATSIFVRLASRALTFEQRTIEVLLDVAKKNGAVLSIDTRDGPLVATVMKPDCPF